MIARRWLIAAGLACALAALRAQHAPITHLVIVVDGLRPDYVTPEVMPRLIRLKERGIEFTAHHSVFPTVTRVNASSFVTGSYPEAHGILGNTIYIPSANAHKPLDTGDRDNLLAVEHGEGRLLTAPSLGEILARAGMTMLGVSSGSTGSSFLLNHTVASGAVIHYDYVLPPALGPAVAERLGPAPPAAVPNDARNQRAIDSFLTIGLDEIHPDVTFMWLNDPDGTAHSNGIGSEITRRSLSLVDAGIGRLEDALRERGLLDRTNILVTSDHGFSTHTGTFDLAKLVAPLTHTVDGEPDTVVAEGAIHLRPPDATRTAAIVAALQKRAEVGAIFTRPRVTGGVEGIVPGTLSFDVARWNHARAGDILVSANWTADRNAAGFAGTTTDEGVAGHGSSSPYDVHNTLIAAGPAFREHTTSDVPTSNVDIAPTLLRLLGVPVPSTMSGRVFDEGFRNGPSPRSVKVKRTGETVRTADGSYQLTARLSIVAGHRYLDFTTVSRPGRR